MFHRILLLPTAVVDYNRLQSLSTLANAGKVGQDRGNDTEGEEVVVGTARASPPKINQSDLFRVGHDRFQNLTRILTGRVTDE